MRCFAGQIVTSVAAGFMLGAVLCSSSSGTDAEEDVIGNMSISIRLSSCVPLPSPWQEYFGTHYASSAEGAGRWWNTVRSYGGPHTGVYANDQSEIHIGPFTGREVRVGLEDFHSRLNRDGKTASQLVPDLIEHRFAAIYQMTSLVRPSTEPFDKDLAYWAIYQIHNEFPEARQYLAWQIGNEVVSGHFDPMGLRQDTGIPEEAPQGQFHGYDLDWKEDYYVDDYLAPAIEAIERASEDVYGDPHTIKVLLGSMNPYNRENIEFLQNVMDRTFAGKLAPTLAGDPVWRHVDVLTVHYMFGGERTVQRMQGYVDDYLRTGKVDGIWATEEHGRAGKGPVTVIDRGFRFLSWVARNGLTAEQARLVWWGDGARKPGGSAREAEQVLGDFLCARTISFTEQRLATGVAYVLHDGVRADVRRVLVAFVPRDNHAIDLGEVRLTLPGSVTGWDWEAEVIRYSAQAAPEKSLPEVDCEEANLRIRVGRPVQEPTLLFVRRSG